MMEPSGSAPPTRPAASSCTAATAAERRVVAAGAAKGRARGRGRRRAGIHAPCPIGMSGMFRKTLPFRNIELELALCLGMQLQQTKSSIQPINARLTSDRVHCCPCHTDFSTVEWCMTAGGQTLWASSSAKDWRQHGRPAATVKRDIRTVPQPAFGPAPGRPRAGCGAT